MCIRQALPISVLVFTAGAASPADAATIGAQATLSEIAHNVSGSVIITDANTFRVDDFTYDGGAPAVYFYLGTEDSQAAFTTGLEISPLLTGTSYDGNQGSLFFDLPAGNTFATYNAISVWCAQFNANFGSGTFFPIEGDLNSDGFVGIADMGIILGNWNQTVPPADPLADPSGDGFVGLDDLNTVLSDWNAGTPPPINSVVPEPTTAATLGCLGFALLRRR